MPESYLAQCRRVFGRGPSSQELRRVKSRGSTERRHGRGRISDADVALLTDEAVAAEEERWREEKRERRIRRHEQSSAHPSGFQWIDRDWRSQAGLDAKPHRGGEEGWLCIGCQVSAEKLHENPKCHTCENWNGCGVDCTFSGVRCPQCGKEAQSEALP